MKIDVEMCPDAGEISRRIYTKEAHFANLRKGGQDNLVYVLTDPAESDEFIQFVKNSTPGSKWDIYTYNTPPENTPTGRKTLRTVPRSLKRKRVVNQSRTLRKMT